MNRIVYLHGFLGSPSEVLEFQPWLPDWDIVGCSLQGDTWSVEVSRIAESLSASDVLCGYSMGARLALAVAIERCVGHESGPTASNARPLRGLILISGNPGGLTSAERKDREAWLAAWTTALENDGGDAFLRKWYDQPLFASEPRQAVESWIAEKRGFDRKEQIRIMRALSVLHQPDLRDLLGRLSVPTLVLAGEHDGRYATMALALGNGIPAARVAIVPAAGHVPHRTHPASCWPIVGDFLAGLPAADPPERPEAR